MNDTLSISVGKEKRKKERKINKNDFSNQLLFVYMTKSYTRYIFQQRINNIERNKTSDEMKDMQTRHHWIHVFDARSIILSCVSSFDFLWKSV